MRISPEKPVEEQIIELLHQPGGYEALGFLIKINPEKLTAAGKIDFLAALEKQNSWLTAIIQRATLAIAGSEPSESESIWEGVDEAEREDVATALRLSASTAQSRIDVARVLSNHLPATCEALANGDISPSHATLIARESSEAIKRGISPEELMNIESKAIAHAEFHTPAQVARKLRTLFAKAAPESFEESVKAAREMRSVRIHPEGDGMATVIALLPIEDAQTVMLAINSFISWRESKDFRCASSREKSNFMEAEQFSPTRGTVFPINPMTPGQDNSGEIHPINSQLLDAEKKSIDMKRADALAEICGDLLARLSDDFQPHRRPVSINITMDLPTALGLANNPAELAGYGAIPASIARELSRDGKWKKFITDPGTGNLLSFGRESYVPPQALVDFVTARDRICRFPGCSQPARVSDIDHVIPWEEGGETSASNLGVLCRRHHRMKTHDGWKLVSNPDGSCTWTSPAGKQIFVPARPINESA